MRWGGQLWLLGGELGQGGYVGAASFWIGVDLIVFFFVQRCMLNERNRVGERILFLFYDVKVFIAPFSALRSYDCHVDLTAD